VTALLGVLVTFVLGNAFAFGLAGAAVSAVGVIVYAAAPWRPARTTEGEALTVRAAGFEHFLRTAERSVSVSRNGSGCSRITSRTRSGSDSCSNGSAALVLSIGPAALTHRHRRAFHCDKDLWGWFVNSTSRPPKRLRRRHDMLLCKPPGFRVRAPGSA
jgi:hypothetical protein